MLLHVSFFNRSSQAQRGGFNRAVSVEEGGISIELRKTGGSSSLQAVHQSSFDKMTAFRRDYLEGRRHEPLVIVDLGSQDVNGSYRPLFALPPWQYIGVDIAAGKNVDVVLADPYDWREFSPQSADVIVAGQTFEHTEFLWETMRQIAHTLKPNGICCIIAPSSGPEHRYPVDCWRVYPDGMRALARYAELEVIEATTQWEDLPEYDNESNKWHDSVLIARKRVQ